MSMDITIEKQDSSTSLRNLKRRSYRAEERSIRLLEAHGYRCCRAAASLGEWDIVGVGSVDVVLARVMTDEWPSVEKLEMLRSFGAPVNCKKVIHCWVGRRHVPDVREIGGAE